MLIDKTLLEKLERIERRYEQERFAAIQAVPLEMAQTQAHLRRVPGEGELAWAAAQPGSRWGGAWQTAWFRGQVELPAACAGHKVFLRPQLGEAEALLFVDGEPFGVFDRNHPVVRIAEPGEPGRVIELAMEAYGGHPFPGTMPDQEQPAEHPLKVYGGAELVLEREDVSAFVFDLRVLRQLLDVLDESSLRYNKVAAALAEVWALVDARPDERDVSRWRPQLAEARRIMQPLLAATNGSTAPLMGLVAHSHIDTAWLWPLAETWRKCARTFSSMTNLMEQYPEIRFLQSAACHADAVRREYPGLFARIKKLVAEGRWEPNGAMWIEPDCNIPSGEALIRQFLFGQRWTQEHFGYTSDTMWQPDVFGYNAQLPQIMRGCGVEFFCTTKLDWNDTTRFPYDTFHWEGLDGSQVLAHFHNVGNPLDPVTLSHWWQRVQHKDVQDRRLFCYGWGDGGGGPQAEMLEHARRLENLEGCPRTEHTTASRFLQRLRDDLSERLPRYVGELYLELHRGTLTSIAPIKRGNRLSEVALREAEWLATLAALDGQAYPRQALRTAWETLLINQFHDILPGTSIKEVNDEAIAALNDLVVELRQLQQQSLTALAVAAVPAAVGEGSVAVPAEAPEQLLVINSLSWDRSRSFAMPAVPEGRYPTGPGVRSQWVRGLEEDPAQLLVSGLSVPALGGVVIELTDEPGESESPFTVNGDVVETPYLRAVLDDAGRLVSLVHKADGREVVAEGGTLNGLALSEDIPARYDNWDIDRDQQRKPASSGRWISREIVADGPVQLRIRNTYELGEASRLVQDTVFHADAPMVSFESVLDWHEKHELLKATFDLAVRTPRARHEMQFGHTERPTHDNLPTDRARFEVCNHRWTDLSDGGWGVAILNDCKYGLSVRGGRVGLTLMKSGTHPDPRGDEGRHRFSYAVLVHEGPFSVEAVVRPAYEFNTPVSAGAADEGAAAPTALVQVDAPNILVETIKWAEEGDAVVLRLYEAGGADTWATLRLGRPTAQVMETNMLEEQPQPVNVDAAGQVRLRFRPFEIKTLRWELG